MPSISGPSITDTGDRIRRRASSTSSSMNSVMPLTSECSSRFSTSQSRHSRPARSWAAAAVAGVPGGRLEQPLGGVGAAGEHDVLAQLAELRIDLLVHRELAGVDDAEAHARWRSRGRGTPSASPRGRGRCRGTRTTGSTRRPRRCVREASAQRCRRLDEVEPVAVVLGDAGGDGEDVGVEDDVVAAGSRARRRAVGRRGRRSRPCARPCRPGPARRTPSRSRPRRGRGRSAPGRGTSPRLPSSRSS